MESHWPFNPESLAVLHFGRHSHYDQTILLEPKSTILDLLHFKNVLHLLASHADSDTLVSHTRKASSNTPLKTFDGYHTIAARGLLDREPSRT